MFTKMAGQQGPSCGFTTGHVSWTTPLLLTSGDRPPVHTSHYHWGGTVAVDDHPVIAEHTGWVVVYFSRA